MKTKNIILTSVLLAITIIAVYIYFQAKKAVQYDYFFKGLSFDNLSMKRTTGTVNLRITNPSNISLNVIEMNLKLMIKGVYISDLTMKSPVEIAANSFFDIPLAFEMEPHKIFSLTNIAALQNILDSNKTMVTITGSIKIKKGIFSFRYPVFFHEPIKDLM